MPFTKEMLAALRADGEKLRQMTGEEHGPAFDECCGYVEWGYSLGTPAELRIPCAFCPRAPR